MLKKQRFILAIIIVLCAFLGQTYNFAFNGHYHLLHSGQSIFHAHPYTKASDESPAQPNHSHSKAQFLCYELLLATLFVLVLIVVFIHILHAKFRLFERPEKRCLLFSYKLHPRRAPPVLSF